MSLASPPTSLDAILETQRRAWLRGLVQSGAVLAVVLGCAWYTGLLDASRLAEGLPSLWQLLTEMMPPDVSGAASWWGPLLDTMAMSIAGTAMAVILSVPLALLAAHNTTPNAVAYRLARVLLNTLRSVPELIMGIVFVAAVGFGTLPGVLALGLHSIGMIGKFFAEAIEHVDEAPIEAARAAGASPFQVVTHAILPQVFPQMADVTIYRWEYNFRASTVLGTVGAGGIGFELIAALRILNYQEVMAIMLLVLLTVTLVDGIGAQMRRRLK